MPELGRQRQRAAGVNIDSEPIQETIRQLVSRRVAITSTLAVFESFFPVPASIDPRGALLLTRSARRDFEREVTNAGPRGTSSRVGSYFSTPSWRSSAASSAPAAGLMGRRRSHGMGRRPCGLADQRNIELLVEAGFSPEAAIQIATANGADSLGQSAKIGTVTPGKQADLVVLRGKLASDIRNIRNVEIVFKDGVGFDSAALMRAEHGKIGLTNWRLWLFAGIFTVLLLLLYVTRANGIAVSRRSSERLLPPRIRIAPPPGPA